MMTSSYASRDQLYLWLLMEPRRPVLIGELNLVRSMQGVSLRYADSWLQRGFSLSEDLPLISGEFLPAERGTAVGAVDDARPDRWGERVIRVLDKPPRLSLLEYLFFAGDDRFGALGVSTSADEYRPRRLGPLPTLEEADDIHELVRKVQANEPVPEAQKRLISPGVTMGGARPKALLDIAAEQWVIKFADGEPADTPLIEHASMTLARKAGIRVAQTMPVRLTAGHAVAIKRFDRRRALRLHSLCERRASGSATRSSHSSSGGAASSNETFTSPKCTSFFEGWFSTFCWTTRTITKRTTCCSSRMHSNTSSRRPSMYCRRGRRSGFSRCLWASRRRTRRSPTPCRWRGCSRSTRTRRAGK